MSAINNKATRPSQHNSMYVMLMISIAMFFVFLELIISPQIIKIMETIDYTLPVWMSALAVILAVFSFIYYHYLCVYTFEEKAKDYGILSSFGYSKKKILKCLFEALAKSVVISVICGLLLGTLFYCTILILLNSTLSTTFKYPPLQGYFFVCIVYMTIFGVNVFSLRKKISSMETFDMLNYKKQEKNILNPALFQNIGIALLVLGVLLLFVLKNSEVYNMASALLPMLSLTACAYFLTLSFAHWFPKLFITSKTRYLNNLFYISQLRTNYKKYAEILTACTIIVIFGLYMIIMDISFTTSSSSHDFEMPFDFIVSGDDMGSSTSLKIRQFESAQGQSIKTAHLVEVADGAIQWDGDGYNRKIHIMPETSYESLMGKSLTMQQGEIIVLSQINREYYDVGTQFDDGIEWGFQPPGDVSFQISDKIFKGRIIGEIWENVYNISDQNIRTYIISSLDYVEIIQKLGNRQWIYFVSVSNRECLTDINEQLQAIGSQIDVKSENMETYKQNNMMVAFLILLAAMLLFVSLISLIILRIHQNIKEEKKKYTNLFFVGYSSEQVETELKKEMSTLFFLPLVIGSVIAVIYTVFSNTKVNLQLAIITIIAILLLLAVEYILYKITVKLLLKQYLS